MKKTISYFVLVMLVLATLACGLPFLNQAQEPSMESTEGAGGEGSIPLESATSTQEVGGGNQEPRIFSDNGVEITLRGSFVLGDVEKDLPILAEGLKVLIEAEEINIRSLYEQNKEDIALWGYDTASQSQYTTSLIILKNEELAGTSLAIISVFANGLLKDAVDTIKQDRLTFGDREVLRFLTTSQSGGIESAQAIYMFNETEKLWMIGFFTSQAEIEQRLGAFDAAVASFRFIPAE